MSDKGSGKWLPYDLNGEVHECKQTGTKKVETKSLTLEVLDKRLRRVESMFAGPQK